MNLVEFLAHLRISFLLPDIFNVRLSLGFQVSVWNGSVLNVLFDGIICQTVNDLVAPDANVSWNPGENYVRSPLSVVYKS